MVHVFGFIIKKSVTMHGHMNVKQARTNIIKQRKIPNTTRNIAGNLSASWQYGNNICALPTASSLLVCKLCKGVSREMKNCFRGFCVNEKLGNTDLEAFRLLL
jgi:hypothetical protein